MPRAPTAPGPCRPQPTARCHPGGPTSDAPTGEVRSQAPADAANPVVQLLPPVEVIWIVDAATAPVESLDPAAVTQSPTARSEEAAAWRSL